MEANLGGTEIFQPLKNIFESELIPGYLRQIFILTDGEVSEQAFFIIVIGCNHPTTYEYFLS